MRRDLVGDLRSVRIRGVLVAALAIFACALAPAAANAADTIYWNNASANAVSFANLDGSGGGGDLSTTGATVSYPSGLAIDAAANRIYWANYSASKISWTNLDGSGGGDLTTTGATVQGPFGIAIDPALGRVYWSNFNANSISYANLDGSGGGNLDTSGATVANPDGVTVDPATGRIYWTNQTAGISYANLDGSGGGGDLDTTGATVVSPTGLAIDSTSGKLYWANQGQGGQGAGGISYANLDGSGGGGDLDTTGATVSGPVGVAINEAAGRVYWTNFQSETVSYANLDGSGGGDLDTSGATVDGTSFPALLVTPVGTGAPAISGGTTVGSSLSCSQGSWASDQLEAFLYRAPGSFAYQWSLNGSAISGATSATYTATAPGQYTCTVTATNAAGPTDQTSSAHTIAASTPPVAKHTLTVTKQGSGQGTVTSSPSGIDCGSTCSASYSAGTAVTLTASAATGSKFSGWSGACTGTGACTVTMSADKTVTASFALMAPNAGITPNTEITHAAINGAAHTAAFKFKAIGKASGFKCALVKLTKHPKKPTYGACRSPKTYKHLAVGRYKFLVRAFNASGSDATPASRSFTIRTPRPPSFTG